MLHWGILITLQPTHWNPHSIHRNPQICTKESPLTEYFEINQDYVFCTTWSSRTSSICKTGAVGSGTSVQRWSATQGIHADYVITTPEQTSAPTSASKQGGCHRSVMQKCNAVEIILRKLPKNFNEYTHPNTNTRTDCKIPSSKETPKKICQHKYREQQMNHAARSIQK